MPEKYFLEYINKSPNQKKIIKKIFFESHFAIAFVFEDQDNKMMFNKKYEEIVGWSTKEILEKGWESITYPNDLEKEKMLMDKLRKGEINNFFYEKRYIRKDGTIIWAELWAIALEITSDNKINYLAFLKDITANKETQFKLKESERSKETLLSHIPGIAYRSKFNKNWTMEYMSEGTKNLTGYKKEDFINDAKLSFNDIILDKYREQVFQGIEDLVSKKMNFKKEYQIMTANGTIKWVYDLGEGVFDEKGNVAAIEGVIIDITALKNYQQYFKHQSERDYITDLYNRKKLQEDFEQIPPSSKKAFVIISLIDLSSISVRLGLHYFNELVLKISLKLRKLTSENKRLYRNYEYGLTFLITNYNNHQELLDFYELIKKQIESILSTELVNIGVGIFEIPQDSNFEDAIRKSSLAASESVKSATSFMNFFVYDEAMDEKLRREEVLKKEFSEIAKKEKHDDIFLVFQPIIASKTGKTEMFESLSRYKSKNLGYVSPIEFIPILEKTKLIREIGKIIFIKSLEFLKEACLIDSNIKISINLSYIQILEKDFEKTFLNIIEKMKVNPKQIVFEITETVMARNFYKITKIIENFKKIGVRFAMDDFGTGYSTLYHQKELNVDIIKIDKKFTDNIGVVRHPIISDIISICHKAGQKVIVEGVESREQRDLLRKYKSDFMQGYYVSKALSFDDAIKFLKNNKK